MGLRLRGSSCALVGLLAVALRASGEPSPAAERVAPRAADFPTGQPAEQVPSPSPVGRGAVSLADIEQMALANNPTLAQAASRVAAAQGAWTQSGLYPNPILGYVANQIGDAGGPGQQGAYFQQQFVLGGKLRLNRAVAAQDVRIARRQLSGQQLRVLNDVRIGFYDVLVAQRMLAASEELVRVGNAGMKAAEDMFRAEYVSQVDVLQARIEAQHAQLQRATAENRLNSAWKSLAAMVGVPSMERAAVTGLCEADLPVFEFDQVLARLWHESPELGVAGAGVERARWALARAAAEPVPNLDVQYYPQHDNTSTRDIHNVQATVTFPLFNRNQGAIRQAQANLAAARQEFARVRLDLQQRLAAAFESYANARRQVDAYQRSILPDARKSLDLVTSGYRRGEFSYVVLLTAQRTFFQTNLAYLEALRSLRSSTIAIDGLLLTNSLGTSQLP